MRTILLPIILIICSLSANAQFTVYHSTTEYEQAQQNPIQSVYGYLPTPKGWVRISIRIKESNQSILVVGYKEKDTSTYGGAFTTYGNPNLWRSCQSWAESVNVYIDGQEIANNFDYKVSITGLGTIYF